MDISSIRDINYLLFWDILDMPKHTMYTYQYV